VEALERGEPIPFRLPGERKLFRVPAGLLRIFNHDLKMAGIPKKDERGRTLDVHALRTTLASLMNKAGVAPRTAQAAMRHSDIRLTMETYTDPKLLDVRGALDSLPALPLDGDCISGEAASATGTDGVAEKFAPKFAPTQCKRGQTGSSADKMGAESGPTDQKDTVAVKSCGDKRKGRLSSPDSRPDESGREDLNLR